MKLQFDSIIYEATAFTQALDRTAVRIHSVAYQALIDTLDQQLERVNGWSEEDTGVSQGQYENYIREESRAQIKALTIMTFALMATTLMGFIRKTNATFIERHCPKLKPKYGTDRDGEIGRAAAEYSERYGIDFSSLPGFEICKEIMLARNSCVHDDCAPSEDYMTQTAHRFLAKNPLSDCHLLIVDDKGMADATQAIKLFAVALARATRERVDAAKKEETNSGSL